METKYKPLMALSKGIWERNGRFQQVWRKLHFQEGVETVEYLGLASVVVIFVGAVALYLSGAGQVLIDLIADLITNIIANLERGW